MNRPATYEEALALVPTHWPLTPGVDKWQKDDEVLRSLPNLWQVIDYAYQVRMNALLVSRVARRPIPDRVRKAMAEMARRAESGTVDYTSTIIVSRWLAGLDQ